MDDIGEDTERVVEERIEAEAESPDAVVSPEKAAEALHHLPTKALSGLSLFSVTSTLRQSNAAGRGAAGRGAYGRVPDPGENHGRASIRRIFQALSFNFSRFGGRSDSDSDEESGGDSSANSGSEPIVFSMPAFKLRPFSRPDSANTDLVVIYTNGIRNESRLLYTILYCLHERSGELDEGDIKSFFLWFEDYHDMFCVFMHIMNDVLIPALRDMIPFRHMTPNYFASEGERLNRIVNKTARSSPTFLHRYSATACTNKLLDIYTHFAQPLLWYLFSLEKYCAVVIQRFATAEATRVISLAMAAALKDSPHFKRVLPLVLRCLEHRPQTTFTWLSQHYHFHTVRLYRYWRRPTEHERTFQYFKLVSKVSHTE